MLGNLIGGFVVILIAVTLVPTIGNAVAATYYGGNVTKGTVNANLTYGSDTIINLVTLFFCLSIASIGIGIAYSGLKQAGFM